LEAQSKWLRKAAAEIAAEGHTGWGNTCTQAADLIATHHAEIADALKDARRYRFIRDVPYAENIRLIMRDQCNGIMDKAIDAAIDAHTRAIGNAE
jgi:hypothetical protein